MGEWGLEVRRADGRREASVPRRNRPFLPQLLVVMVAAAVPWSLLLLLLLCRVWSGSEQALWRSRRGRQLHDAAAARPADPAAATARRRAAASGGEGTKGTIGICTKFKIGGLLSIFAVAAAPCGV